MWSMSVSFGRSRWGGYVLVGAAALAFWRWDTLSWHARGIVLGLFGLAVVLVWGIPALRVRSILQSGTRTQGTVVDMEETEGDSDSGPTYHPVVKFTTADGRTVEFTGSVGFSVEPELGTVVPVRYRPDDPNQAEVDRRYLMWLMPAIPGLLGLGLLVAAVIVYRHE